jgi:hypothetical protein
MDLEETEAGNDGNDCAGEDQQLEYSRELLL